MRRYFFLIPERLYTWERAAKHTPLEASQALPLTIIMSKERPSDHTRIHQIAGSPKGKLSSFSHLSRVPAPPSIDIDSSSDNVAK